MINLNCPRCKRPRAMVKDPLFEPFNVDQQTVVPADLKIVGYRFECRYCRYVWTEDTRP